MKKEQDYVIPLIILLTILGVIMMVDYPDWTVPTNITNSYLDVNVTNSMLDVTIVDSTTTLTVTGDVNATIDGQVSVSIDNATVRIDTATLTEIDELQGRVYSETNFASLSPGADAVLSFTSLSGGGGGLLELITGIIDYPDGITNSDLAGVWIEVTVKDRFETPQSKHYAHISQLPLSFDPALPIPSGGSVDVRIHNGLSKSITVAISIAYRPMG